MNVQWNTKRMYTEHGQRIRAEYRDGVVYFKDFDRMIAGEIKVGFVPPKNTNWSPWLKQIVMRHYDTNSYDMSCEALNIRWEE